MEYKDSSPAENFLTFAAKVPWWLALLFAFISFFIFHSLAAIEPVTPNEMEYMAKHINQHGLKIMATILQYLLPGIFILGAFLSFYGKSCKSRQLDS